MGSKLSLISLTALGFLLGCERPPDAILKVYHAGSLSVPFKSMATAFEQSRPDAELRLEAYGSAMAIRQVTELGKAADVVASADFRLIDRMMIEAPGKWASWNLVFARNSMCMAYGKHSPAVTAGRWTEALQRSGVKIGISDPRSDPSGYRSLMLLYLAQTQLEAGNIFDRLVLHATNIRIDRDSEGSILSVPASPRLGPPLVIRPKSTELIPLLSVGAVDYVFLYRSVAVQHGLEFVELPDEVDLSEPSLEDVYGRVRLRLLGAGSAEDVEVGGGLIAYGITIPRSALHPELAEDFVSFVFSEKGRQVLSECGQEPVWPPLRSEASEAGAVPTTIEVEGSY